MMQIYPAKSQLISEFWRDKYERDAMRNWDKFYKRNSDRFFKDRHYLDKEWGSYFENLVSTKGVVLEAGCGAGNTVFPLLAGYPHLFVHACDFSPRAVNIVMGHNDYSVSRLNAFVCDVTSEPLTKHVEVASVDIATLVFMLSAVSPDRMSAVLQNLRSVLKPGGRLLFRDYCVGDLSEERFKKKDQQISDNFFVRGDGTRAYYFSELFLTELFEREGFVVESLDAVAKVVENRSRGLLMDRRWIQGVFRLIDPAERSVDELGITEIFAEDPVVEETEIVLGSFRICAKAISRTHQHTCQNTGLMLWESAFAMSRMLLSHPSLLENKTILELGSGCVGLCSLVASVSAGVVIATDADTQALDLMQQNLKANSERFPVQKVSCQRLVWGNQEDISAALQRSPGGFEVILGTDVTYVSEALGDLFGTAKALISRTTTTDGGYFDSSLLLCHLARKADEEEIIVSAASYGFFLWHKCLGCDECSPLEAQQQQRDQATSFPSTFMWFHLKA